MDKIAIISDIHGNIVALKQVLDDIKSRGVTRIFCLGDLIAKGSHPKESIELIKNMCEVVIKGNCEEVITEKNATLEHVWNKEKIGQDNIEYLKQLPLSYSFYMSGLKIKLIHASPNSLYNSINYYDINDNLNNEINNMFEYKEEKPDVVIFGHIHSPFLYKLEDKTLVNPGAVSNGCDIIEKDGKFNELSSYMILEGEYGSKDASSISYEIVKVPFDYEKEIEFLKNSDMPNKELAIEELLTGVYKKR